MNDTIKGGHGQLYMRYGWWCADRRRKRLNSVVLSVSHPSASSRSIAKQLLRNTHTHTLPTANDTYIQPVQFSA